MIPPTTYHKTCPRRHSDPPQVSNENPVNTVAQVTFDRRGHLPLAKLQKFTEEKS
jgi:hypothetical protein